MVTGFHGLDADDPAQILYRQDTSFGPDSFDFGNWAGTLEFPFHEWLNERLLLLGSPQQIYDRLDPGNKELRALGVSGLRSMIFSHVRPNDSCAILWVRRQRLDFRQRVINHRDGVWTMSRNSGRWLAKEFSWNSEDEPIPESAQPATEPSYMHEKLIGAVISGASAIARSKARCTD